MYPSWRNLVHKLGTTDRWVSISCICHELMKTVQDGEPFRALSQSSSGINSRKDHLAIKESLRNTVRGESCRVVLEIVANARNIGFANTDREWRLKIESYGLSDSWGDLSKNKTNKPKVLYSRLNNRTDVQMACLFCALSKLERPWWPFWVPSSLPRVGSQ